MPILGMHRSGTSMLARALHALGLELGPSLLDATPDNPQGYWENPFFVQINAELLHTMKCDSDGFGPYDELMRLPKLCQRIIIEHEKLAKIREFIHTTFSSRTWGWKDPRTVLTYDVWQRLLETLRFRDIRPVVIVRHPAGSVSSLVRRAQRDPANRISADRLTAMATEIWMAYNRILWDRCLNQNWFVGTYESLIDPRQARSELIRLAEYCGFDESGIGVALESIAVRDPAGVDESFADVRAIRLYNQFRQVSQRQVPQGQSRRGVEETQRKARHVTVAKPGTASSDPAQDTVIKAEPDERRLLQRAEQFRQAGQIDAAIDLLHQGLKIRPQYRAAQFMLGTVLMESGQITRSAAHARLLIEASPQDAVGHGLLAFGLTQQARIAEAIEAFRECIRCLPHNNAAWSNMLFASLYGDHHDANTVTELHREAGGAIERNATCRAEKSPDPATPRPATRRPAKTVRSGPLRVGYLSADLKQHPVGWFLRPILEHHDRSQVHSVCYYVGSGQDPLTEVLKHASDSWRDAGHLTDDELLARIHEDDIDLLIDLCGHTAGNRAGMVARRAAPVQAMYLGYPCTSGLRNMDFVISDLHLSPPEQEGLYTETVQRLEGCFLCFSPPVDAPPVAPPPWQSHGHITFGSFNNLPKISPATVRLWSEILHAVPKARLALKALSFVDAGTRDLFHAQFEAHQIDRSRIDLLPPTRPFSKFLDEYRRIDIALDPLPYNGGTTTCEALWMGVPVITLPGQHFFCRMGLSILKTLALEECIAETPADYVRIAVELARDPDRLTQYRSTFRARLLNSALCNGPEFTRGLEAAYWAMMNAVPPQEHP